MSSVATLPERARQVLPPRRRPRPEASHDGDARRALWVAVGPAAVAWVLLVVAAIWWGPGLLPEGAAVRAAPFMGHWQWGASPALAVPLALGAATVVYGPRLAAELSWRALVAVAGAVTTAWSLALASVDGWHRVSYPMTTDHEYLAAVDQIEGPGWLLRTFTERFASYPIHVRGHPPGMPLLLWIMDRLGLGGAGWATALVLAGAGLATAATLATVRSVAGEQVVRRVAPFVAVAPAAVWLGTTVDAFFAGVIALGIALLVGSRTNRTKRLNLRYLAGGVVLGLALFLSYGAVPLLLIPAGVWLYRRDLIPLLWAAAGAALVTLAFWASGFWWFDGLAATMDAYGNVEEAAVSLYRPYEVFVPLLNPATLAVATGPVVAAGLAIWVARRRDWPVTTWLLPVLALTAVLVANVSGLSKGEVERIWLPFVPWLLVFAALVPRARAWLAVQVGLAVVVQLSLHSPW